MAVITRYIHRAIFKVDLLNRDHIIYHSLHCFAEAAATIALRPPLRCACPVCRRGRRGERTAANVAVGVGCSMLIRMLRRRSAAPELRVNLDHILNTDLAF